MSNTKLPPQEFYEKQIAPYKAELELWYQRHRSFWVDLIIIFLTVWAVIFPNNSLAHKFFKNLPKREITL